MRGCGNPEDPMHDPTVRKLLALAAMRLAAGYTACEDVDQANRWSDIAWNMSEPLRCADAGRLMRQSACLSVTGSLVAVGLFRRAWLFVIDA